MGTQRIVGLMFDQGDGSCVLHWFRDCTIADRLLDSDDPNWDESTWPNEGAYAEELVFPDYLDLEQCGFRFSDDMLDDIESDD